MPRGRPPPFSLHKIDRREYTSKRAIVKSPKQICPKIEHVTLRAAVPLSDGAATKSAISPGRRRRYLPVNQQYQAFGRVRRIDTIRPRLQWRQQRTTKADIATGWTTSANNTKQTGSPAVQGRHIPGYERLCRRESPAIQDCASPVCWIVQIYLPRRG